MHRLGVAGSSVTRRLGVAGRSATRRLGVAGSSATHRLGVVRFPLAEGRYSQDASLGSSPLLPDRFSLGVARLTPATPKVSKAREGPRTPATPKVSVIIV